MSWIELSYLGGWCLLTAVVGIGFWRVAKGPAIFDRLIGFDTAMIGVAGMIILFSIAEQTGEHLELIIVITALGFFTTVSYFYYLSQSAGKIGEGDNGAKS